MGQFVIIYFTIASGVLGTWLIICWCEEVRLNLFMALLCSLFWAIALLYTTARYAVPWVAIRLYRDARLVLARPPDRRELSDHALRPPRDVGIYD